MPEKFKATKTEYDKENDYKRIVIYAGDEYRAKVDDRCDSRSFFIDVYKDAIKIVSEIIKETNDFYEEIKDVDCDDESYIKAYGNNVIVVVGKRGEGKTTALQTISRTLESFPNNKPYRDIEGVFSNSEVLEKGIHFEILDSIDPSVLNEKSSLLSVFLSKLFYRFNSRNGTRKDRRLVEKRELDCNDYYRNDRCNNESHLVSEIYNLFSECGKYIEFLEDCSERSKDYDGNLEEMFAKGNSAYLQKKIYSLIMKYLQWTSGNRNCRSNYLVVQIDDADLSDSNIYKMCKDIHYFLRIPQVIVLIGMNIEKMQYFVLREKTLRYSFKENDKYYLSQKDEIESETGQFIEKVFPSGNRILLPNIWDCLYSKVDKVFIEYIINHNNVFSDIDLSLYSSLYEQLCYEIYKRTGLLLTINKNNLIFPSSMRELTHLLRIINSMDAIDVNRIDEIEADILSAALNENIEELQFTEVDILYESLKKNIELFRRYLINDVFETKLNLEEQGYVRFAEKNSNRWNYEQLYYRACDLLDIKKKTRSYKILGIIRMIEKANNKLLSDSLGQEEYADKHYPVLAEFLRLYYSVYLSLEFADLKVTDRNITTFKGHAYGILELPTKIGMRFKTNYILKCSPIDMSRIQEIVNKRQNDKIDAKYRLLVTEDNIFDFSNVYVFLFNSAARKYVGNNKDAYRELFENKGSITIQSYFRFVRTICTNFYSLEKINENLSSTINIEEFENIFGYVFDRMTVWYRDIPGYYDLYNLKECFNKSFIDGIIFNILLCDEDNRKIVLKRVSKHIRKACEDFFKLYEDVKEENNEVIEKLRPKIREIAGDFKSNCEKVISSINPNISDKEERKIYDMCKMILNTARGTKNRIRKADIEKMIMELDQLDKTSNTADE